MNHRITLGALVLCALSDLAAVPLVSGSDDLGPGFGVALAVLGVLTLAAAYGLSRGSDWARRAAIGTRVVDGAFAAPAIFAGIGAAETSAATVTVVLSLATIVLLLRRAPSAVRTA